MARDHARVDIAIWDDPDWLDLSADAQRLYLLLLSQKDLSYCGLLPMRLRRWAKLCSSTTVEGVTAALAELHNTRFVLVDHDHEEVLVRSLVRNDGIWKQPNTLAGALRVAFEMSSPILRASLADELRRLPVDVVGQAPLMTAAALLAGAHEIPAAVKAACGTGRRSSRRSVPAGVQPPVDDQTPEQNVAPAPGSVEPAPEVPPANTSGPIPSPDPSRIPSALGQGEGSRGKGWSSRLTSCGTQVQGVAPTRVEARTREEATRLVAEHVPNSPSKVTTRLVGEVSGLLAEDIATEHVVTGLRTWASKRLGVGLLPELVAEAMRAPVITQAAGRSRTEDAVAAAMELVHRMAAEDGQEQQADELAALLGVGIDHGRELVPALAGAA